MKRFTRRRRNRACPNYRRNVFCREKRGDNGELLRTLCGWLEDENHRRRRTPSPHYTYAGEILPRAAVSRFSGCLKGTRGLIICETNPEPTYKNRTRAFWRRGYRLNTAGNHAPRSQEDINR